MKKQKKFGRKLALNKETIAALSQKKVIGGRTEVQFTVCACPCQNTEDTDACTFIGDTCEGTCGGETCLFTVCDPCTNARTPCMCKEPLTTP